MDTVSDVGGHCQLSADVGYNVSVAEAPLPGLVEEQTPARNYQMDLNSVPFCYSFILLSLPYTNTCTSDSSIYCSLPSTGLACT